jgi:hypothetical protein
MKKHITVFFSCVMLLLADYIWFDQTLGLREDLSETAIISLIAVQTSAAATVVLLGLMVWRKTYARQKKPASRRSGFAIVQPLRRLFVSVWS